MNLLFLGDSITDCSHSFDRENLGYGFVRMIAEELSQTDNTLSVSNKGIDGFTVSRVYEMWQRIPRKERYDIVTVLVGINDVGIWMDQDYTAGKLEDFRRDFIRTYEDLASDILDYGIPKILLLEPFIFPCPEKYRLWEPFRQQMAKDIQDIARRLRLSFVPLQATLENAGKSQGYPAITLDGIHLTDTGNRLLAKAWLESAVKISG